MRIKTSWKPKGPKVAVELRDYFPDEDGFFNLRLECGHKVRRRQKWRRTYQTGKSGGRISDPPPGWVYCEECGASDDRTTQ